MVDLVADTQLCKEDADLINKAVQTESGSPLSIIGPFSTIPGTLIARNLFTWVTSWSSVLFLFQPQLNVPEKFVLFVGV